jgi:hypothetical protein
MWPSAVQAIYATPSEINKSVACETFWEFPRNYYQTRGLWLRIGVLG